MYVTIYFGVSKNMKTNASKPSSLMFFFLYIERCEGYESHIDTYNSKVQMVNS